jgi:hypothetical protein
MNSLSSVDLPVPASPVRNTFRPDSITANAASCSPFSSTFSSILQPFRFYLSLANIVAKTVPKQNAR